MRRTADTRRGRLPVRLLAASLLLTACAAASSAAGETPRAATAARSTVLAATARPQASQAASPTRETSDAQPATDGPTSVPATPNPPTAIPATPCADAACVLAATHLWLDRPIAAGLVNYVDRSYPYGSTQAGQREPHHGVEFFNPTGTPVLAAGAGEVLITGLDDKDFLGPQPNFYGKLVLVRLDRTYDSQPVFNLYGHLSAIAVEVGDRVQPGDVLGAVGSTGVAIGPHLHFEVRVGRNDYHSTRNPELWLKPLLYDGDPLGAIAGRVVDPAGNLLPEVTVVIRPLAVNVKRARSRYIQTYAEDPAMINGDDRLQENFALGDVPVGLFSVSVNTTKFYQQTLTVQSGEVAWIVFVVNPPLPGVTAEPETEVPPTETVLPATSETPPTDATPEPEAPS